MSEIRTIEIGGVKYNLVPVPSSEKPVENNKPEAEPTEEAKEDIEVPTGLELCSVPTGLELCSVPTVPTPPPLEEPPKPQPIVQAEQPKPSVSNEPPAESKQSKLEKVATHTIDGIRIYEYKRPRIRKDKDGNDQIVYSTIKRVYQPHERSSHRKDVNSKVVSYLKTKGEEFEDLAEAYDSYCECMLQAEVKPYAYNTFLQQFLHRCR